MSADEPTTGRSTLGGVFGETRWTLVLASRGDSPRAQQALSDLCAAYYAPVVTFLRSEGRSEDAARELAHEFFARVLDGFSFERADPRRGRFRSYLLGALKHFLANRRLHDQREKRGGLVAIEPLASDTDISFAPAIADPAAPAPDLEFDRQWTLSILERIFQRLKDECEQSGTGREFQILKPWLTGEAPRGAQAEAARRLGISEGALRIAVHRLRRRFRDLVKAEVAHTVRDPADVAQEIRHLLGAL